jgi:hypothetical protein
MLPSVARPENRQVPPCAGRRAGWAILTKSTGAEVLSGPSCRGCPCSSVLKIVPVPGSSLVKKRC